MRADCGERGAWGFARRSFGDLARGAEKCEDSLSRLGRAVRISVRPVSTRMLNRGDDDGDVADVVRVVLVSEDAEEEAAADVRGRYSERWAASCAGGGDEGIDIPLASAALATAANG